MTAPSTKRPAGRYRKRFRAYAQRVKTGWFTGIFTVLFLGVTAFMGGLDPVEQQPLAQLLPGEFHESAQLELTVERAVLIDTFAEAGAHAGPGERVLALTVTAENRWSEPLMTVAGNTVSGAVTVDALADLPPVAVARYDDATPSPWLQPGVPARLVVTWVIPEALFTDGDEIALTLNEASLQKGSFVTYGETWTDWKPVAQLRVTAEDVGAGVGVDE